MKKFLLIATTLIFSFILISCDYDEKSINGLSQFQIPKEVTTDFELPRGNYGAITYTSNNKDVLYFEDLRFGKVIQQDEDVLVTIEARVNTRFKNFDILVLKKGSNKTIKEQGLYHLENFDLPYRISNQFKLPKQIGEVTFEYTISNNKGLVQLDLEDDYYTFVPMVITKFELVEFISYAYYIHDNEYKEYLGHKSFEISVNLTDYEDKHLNVLKSFDDILSPNKADYPIKSNLDLPLTSLLYEDVTISWNLIDSDLAIISDDGSMLIIIRQGSYDRIYLVVTISIDGIDNMFCYNKLIQKDYNNNQE